MPMYARLMTLFAVCMLFAGCSFAVPGSSIPTKSPAAPTASPSVQVATSAPTNAPTGTEDATVAPTVGPTRTSTVIAEQPTTVRDCATQLAYGVNPPVSVSAKPGQTKVYQAAPDGTVFIYTCRLDGGSDSEVILPHETPTLDPSVKAARDAILGQVQAQTAPEANAPQNAPSATGSGQATLTPTRAPASPVPAAAAPTDAPVQTDPRDMVNPNVPPGTCQPVTDGLLRAGRWYVTESYYNTVDARFPGYPYWSVFSAVYAEQDIQLTVPGDLEGTRLWECYCGQVAISEATRVANEQKVAHPEKYIGLIIDGAEQVEVTLP